MTEQTERDEHLRQYAKLLTRNMYGIQKERLAIEGRIRAFEQGGGVMRKNLAAELKTEIADMVNDFEMMNERKIAAAVKNVPIMKWLKKVKGIGPRYSGAIIGMIGAPPETVSRLWSYCGMSVIPVCRECGRIAYSGEDKVKFITRQVERRWEQRLKKWEYELAKKPDTPKPDEEDFQRDQYLATGKMLCQCEESDIMHVAPGRKYYKGLLLTHDPFLKMTCWKIAGQFVRQGKFYRTHYEQQKEYYTNRDGDTLSLGHIENRARRATVKLFLSHLWEMWRKSLGMEAGQIYLQHKLGDDFDKYHTYIDPPYVGLYDVKDVAAG